MSHMLLNESLIVELKGKWERIEAGGSITHEITVKPLLSGPQNITSAVFNYQPKAG